MKTVTIIGRKWFEKTNGNTYHTASIIVNGEHVITTPMEYGYGDQYQRTAEVWLRANGYMPNELMREPYSGQTDKRPEMLRSYCTRNGIAYHAEDVTVGRKRDL